MSKFIISESEKERIRVLYEINEPAIQPSEFVNYLSQPSVLNVDKNLMLALDWSVYEKTDQKKMNQLSVLFSKLTPVIREEVKKIKSDSRRLASVKSYLSNYKGSKTAKQNEFLVDLLKELNTPLQNNVTTTTTTIKQQTQSATNQQRPSFTPSPAKPTLSLYGKIKLE